jgi:hypothetical protein
MLSALDRLLRTGKIPMRRGLFRPDKKKKRTMCPKRRRRWFGNGSASSSLSLFRGRPQLSTDPATLLFSKKKTEIIGNANCGGVSFGKGLV